MKKVISLCLVCLLLFSFSGCNKREFSENTSAESAAASETGTVVTDGDSEVPVESDVEEETGTETQSGGVTTAFRDNTEGNQTTRTAPAGTQATSAASSTTKKTPGNVPKACGTFIQPWLCEDWSESQWESHYDKLLDVDIHIMIIQWVAETPYGKFSYVGYPSAYASSHKASGYTAKTLMLNNALQAAEKKGIQVFVGINLSDEWWDNKFTSASWCKSQADAGNIVAKETYDLYKAKYPHAFYGWYYAWEMYNQNSGYENDWASMMNLQLDYLTKLDGSMPVLFSPFISAYIRSTPAQLEAQWTSFCNQTHFRSGDIFCPQDSVGASGLTMDYLDGQLAAMQKAAAKKAGLKFWVNCETFVGSSGGTPAPVDRFIKQLAMASKYTDSIVTFSYSHYYADKKQYSDAYKAYLGL